MNTGFTEPSKKELYESKKKGYVLGAFGGVDGKPINPSGDWVDYLPEFEPQKRSIETSSCTQFATISIIQTLENFKWGKANNYSERALAILSENSRAGNSPHKVADTVRKYGLVPEEMLPFTDEIKSWEEYMLIDEQLYEDLKTEGQKWLNKYDFNHEWVNPNPEEMKEALKRSPLGMSVYAWVDNDEIYYKPENARDNHWTAGAGIVGYKDGEYWLIYDSYLDDGEPFKKLEWDYDFGYLKVFYLDKAKPNWFERLINAIMKLFNA